MRWLRRKPDKGAPEAHVTECAGLHFRPMNFASFQPSARLAALALGALVTISLSAPAHAQWKWKDKNGHVQYSDLPPPQSVSDADILQRPSGSAAGKAPTFAPNSAQAAAAALQASGALPSASGSGKGGIDAELEAKRRKAADEEATKKRAEEERLKAARADNCQRAKAQLRAIDDGMRMARVNDKGEREYLDDKTRADEAKRARDVMASDCK